MRRSFIVKGLSALVSPRKTAKSAAAITRRPFPAWIDADTGAAFSVRPVSSRVRDALILREVAKKRKSTPKPVPHARDAR